MTQLERRLCALLTPSLALSSFDQQFKQGLAGLLHSAQATLLYGVRLLPYVVLPPLQ